jgi:hypothetical protein
MTDLETNRRKPQPLQSTQVTDLDLEKLYIPDDPIPQNPENLHEAKTTWKSKQKRADVKIKSCPTDDAPSLCRVSAQISFFDLCRELLFNAFCQPVGTELQKNQRSIILYAPINRLNRLNKFKYPQSTYHENTNQRKLR